MEIDASKHVRIVAADGSCTAPLKAVLKCVTLYDLIEMTQDNRTIEVPSLSVESVQNVLYLCIDDREEILKKLSKVGPEILIDLANTASFLNVEHVVGASTEILAKWVESKSVRVIRQGLVLTDDFEDTTRDGMHMQVAWSNGVA
jgi:hypothetical protein